MGAAAAGSERHPERWLVGTTEYAGLTAYTGGIGTHFSALLPAVVRRGVRVDLVVFSDSAPLPCPRLNGVHLVEFHRTDGLSPVAALRRRARVVRDVFRRDRYDRIFLPEWSALGAALPRAAPLLTNLATGMRLANEIAGLRLRDLPADRRIPVAVQSSLESRQIRRSKGLVPISTAMLRRAREAFGTRLPPAVVVRNCVDIDRVRAGALSPLPSMWPMVGDDPVVLFLGRSELRKGVIDAVTAFGTLHEHIPSARLVLAGAGGDARFEPTRRELLELLPASARPRVTWLGHLPSDEVFAAVRAASVTICPSRWEGFGNVALEVKSIGTPLVVTSGSGFDDFCVNGVDCEMVPPADPASLAVAIRRLLDEPDWARSLVASASRRIHEFTPDAVAESLLAAADDLLGPVIERDSSAAISPDRADALPGGSIPPDRPGGGERL
jgi:glycosyltransferase involved in cell wall biosynthesis